MAQTVAHIQCTVEYQGQAGMWFASLFCGQRTILNNQIDCDFGFQVKYLKTDIYLLERDCEIFCGCQSAADHRIDDYFNQSFSVQQGPTSWSR